PGADCRPMRKPWVPPRKVPCFLILRFKSRTLTVGSHDSRYFYGLLNNPEWHRFSFYQGWKSAGIAVKYRDCPVGRGRPPFLLRSNGLWLFGAAAGFPHLGVRRFGRRPRRSSIGRGLASGFGTDGRLGVFSGLVAVLRRQGRPFVIRTLVAVLGPE